MRSSWKILICLALLAFSAMSASAIQIGRTTPPEFFVDSNNNTDYNCNYVCYAITNNNGVSYNSVWVTIGSFGGGVVTLASSEDGQVNLGPMSAGEVKYAYFFLQALTKTGPAQTHTVTVYNGLPSLNVSLGSANFSLALTGIISASANKVTAIVTGPTPPTLGGLVTVTVDGDSGTISSTKRWAFSAASKPSWDPGAYELFETVVTLSGCNCPNDGLTYTNNLNFVTPDNKDTHWVAVYKLRAVNTTITPTAVTPLADISSGGVNMKYTTPSSTAGFAPIAISTNGLVLINESVSCGGVSATGTNVTYTLTLSNSSPNDAYMDAFVVTLTGSPTNATYVNNSSKTNNVSYANPTITSTTNSQTLTWSGYFLVPGNGTRNLSFQAAIPAVFGGYTNSAYATIGTNRIDTTLNLGDNSPALCSYVIAPLADVRTTKAGPTNVFAFTNFSYTLSVTNLGPSTASNVIVIDQLPTNVTFVSASSSGFFTNGQVRWTNFALFTNTQSTNLTVTVTAPSASGTITNTVSSTSTTADPDSSNNNGTATNAIVTTAVLAQADVQTTKAGPTNVFAGTNFSYTITLTNLGPSTASSISITDTLPTGVTFVSATGNGIATTNGLVTWTIPSLTNSAVSNLTLTVTAPTGAVTLTNKVSSGSIDFDPVPTNNDGSSTNAIVLTTVTPLADLQATKTGFTNVFAGTNFTYTIALTNLGPSTATSVVVTDTLPTGVTFVTASAGFTFTNGLVTWPIASFTNGVLTNFTVTVTAPPSGTLTNRVSAGSAVLDTVPTNNDGTSTNAIVVTTVTPQADLQATKIGPTNVFAATNFTYTIALTNLGPSTATNIVVTDTLPTNVTFVTASSSFTFTNGLVTWPIASFTNGSATNFTVTVTAPAEGGLTNRVSATAGTFDPTATNNDGTSTNAIVITSVTPQANLQTTKTGPTNVFAGTNFTYTITLTNLGPSPAASVVVTDALPSSVTFVTASSGFNFTNGLVTWPVATFTNGATTNFTVTVTAPASGTLTNRALSGSITFDPVPTNNDGTSTNAIVTTTITPQADLQITKSGPTNVFAATNFSYTIALTNLGPSTATSLVVTDSLPVGVTFVTASSGFTFTNGLVTWPIASFTNGAATNFSITVTAPANGASLTNIVSGGSEVFDPVSGNNDGSAAGAKVITTVTSISDIQTTKTGPTNVFASTNFSYTITVTNLGPSTSSNVLVSDVLPAGVAFVSASGGGSILSNTVTWQIASFTNSATTNFTLTVTAPANAAILTNIVSSTSGTLDLVTTNNDGSSGSAIVVTTITPQSDIASVKTGPGSVLAGTNFSYTITITNYGPSTATSLIVTDALPANVVFVSASTGGTFTNGLVTWPVASLTNGAVTNLTVTVTAPAGGSLTNRVSSGSPIFDPFPANNNGTATNAVVVTDIVPLADLFATKTGPTNVFATTNFSYTISLTNIGPSTATSVVVTDALPANVTFVSASAGYTFTNGLVTWPIAAFTNGASTNFTITVTAPPAGSLTNRVSAGGTTIDPASNNNDGSATDAIVITTVTPLADLVVLKSGPTNVYAATNYSYTINVTNLGPSLASSVVVTDALPTQVTFVTASGGFSFTNGIVTWPMASLASGASTNFSVTVTAPTEGFVTNRASAGSATLDLMPGNSDGSSSNATVITYITPLADIQTTKAGAATVGAGTNLVYTISVTNAGPSTASNIVVLDTLPAGVNLISVSSGGISTTNSVTWNVASLTNGAITNFTVTINPLSGPITNYVSSTATTEDPTPGNNDGTSPNARVITEVAVGVNVSGYAYNDVNQNGFRDTSEVGTGLTLYAKIFPASTPTGPATQAVAVNVTTGAYTLSNVMVGTYTIILDDNNTLSDVTPTLPSGWAGIESPAQIRENITVANTALVNQNFGLIQAVTLKGFVFKDNGVSGGTPNDGIKNGSETGIASVIVKLTDTSGASVYSTATTIGDGSYTLIIPNSITNGMQLKIVEVNLTGYRSTGASVGNTSGTYERTNDVVTFTFAGGVAYTGINFGDVPENELTTDGQQNALPGTIVVYTHNFIAGSAGNVTFSTAKVPSPNIPGWNAVIFRDVNCNAQLDPPDTMLTGPVAMVAEEKICLLVKEFVPVAAPFNAQDQVTITASFAYINATPGLTALATRVDLTTVGNPTTAGLNLLKEVDKASAAPGEVITYTITYLNQSSMAISNIVINDGTPPFTKFHSATNNTLGTGLDSVIITAPNTGEAGPVKWTFSGALVPTGTGKVIYKVTIE